MFREKETGVVADGVGVNNLENISFSLFRKLVRRRKFFFSNRNASISFLRVVYIAPQRSKITVTTDEVKFRTTRLKKAGQMYR